jgi:hypothetical protein
MQGRGIEKKRLLLKSQQKDTVGTTGYHVTLNTLNLLDSVDANPLSIASRGQGLDAIIVSPAGTIAVPSGCGEPRSAGDGARMGRPYIDVLDIGSVQSHHHKPFTILVLYNYHHHYYTTPIRH